MKYTPCLAWPNCTKGQYCAYKHPEPLPTYQAAPPMASPPESYLAPAEPIVPGAQEVNGTMYFPLTAPAPPPFFQVPQYEPPYYFPGPEFSPSYELASGPPLQMEQNPQLVLPQDQELDRDMMHSFRYPRAAEAPRAVAAAAAPAREFSRAVEPPRSVAVDEREFPYSPPKIQRAGHARRISVALKPDVTDAPAGESSGGTVKPGARLTHPTRQARKVSRSL